MRTKRQEATISDLARDAILYGFLDPYIAERYAHREEEIKHKLDPSILLFVGKFIVEACIAVLAYDAIKKALSRAFAKRRRISIYELGHGKGT